MANSNLRTGDTVVVIAGKDKGKKGKIVASFAQTNRVTVAGVNIVHKHHKARSQKDKAEIKKVEAPIDASNVQIICPACGKATRIAHKVDEQGQKQRACKKCGAIILADKKAKAVKSKKDEPAKAVAKEEKPVKEAKKAEPKAEKGASAAKKTVETATKKKASETKSQGK